MLMIPIPTGVKEGNCLINFENKEFLIRNGEFWFRSPGAECDKRVILDASPGSEGLTLFMCSSGHDEPGLDNVTLIAPVL
jgi:hypothetical protein